MMLRIRSYLQSWKRRLEPHYNQAPVWNPVYMDPLSKRHPCTNPITNSQVFFQGNYSSKWGLCNKPLVYVYVSVTYKLLLYVWRFPLDCNYSRDQAGMSSFFSKIQGWWEFCIICKLVRESGSSSPLLVSFLFASFLLFIASFLGDTI